MPDYEIFPQVALRAIISPQSAKGTKQFFSELAEIGSKHCDFLVCSATGLRVVAIIELDDRTHNPVKDSQRDAMTRKAGYRTIRYQSKRKPSIAEIRSDIENMTCS